ncbi:MAG: hypothetical protein IJX62_07230 [Clostridia bacterium]|nr:hypothetical protein [Clostridia bacterium]
MNTVKHTPILLSILKWLGISLAALLGLVALILLLVHLFTPVVYNDFYKDAKKEYKIPGLADGFIPQGFAYAQEEKVYLQCGYMKDDSASRIYVLPQGNEKKGARFVTLQTPDGTAYTGHTGGITTNGTLVWLANDGEGEDNCVWIFELSAILQAENGSALKVERRFYPESRAAYCHVEGDYLWVGEFHRPVDYPTKESHAFDVSADVTNRALICAYRLDASAPGGVVEDAPEMLLSVTDHVQGFTRTPDGTFVLSTSYGLATSHLLFYRDVTGEAADATLAINGRDVPVWYLDQEALTKDLEFAPMSEEPLLLNGRIYVLTESASQKYIFGNFTRGRHVYSIPVEE